MNFYSLFSRRNGKSTLFRLLFSDLPHRIYKNTQKHPNGWLLRKGGEKMKRKILAAALLAALCASLCAVPAAAEEEVWVPYDENGQTILTDRDAYGEHGAVSSTSWYASKAGLEILQAGGNAVDAAIATAYALGVVEPYTSGIGGGGYMVIYSAETGEVTMLDFRETAPAAADAEMWLEADGTVGFYTGPDGTTFSGAYSRKNRLGGLAAAVPGEVAGLEYALEHFASGSFSRAQLLQPAIDYANEGYLVTPTMENSTQEELREISGMETLAEYYLDWGFAPETGSTITNPDLAHTLELIAEGGAEVFYTGEIADAIIETVSAYGGVMTKEDLADYRVELREPLVSTYRDYSIYALPPSSSGGAHLLEILNILENYDLASMELNGEEYVHLFAEAMKIAFADREEYMADTAFTEVPLDGLISKEYAADRAAEITGECGEYTAGDPAGHSSTTSFSVVDEAGNMVACTVTIGDFYGSKMAVDGYGFILNDEMYDFDIDPASVNCVEGGKRPLSSMAPSIVLAPDGSPFLTIGTPGATRIFTTVAQVIERMIDYDMDVQEAIETVRVFDSGSGIHYEPDGVNPISADTLQALTAAGYTLTEQNSYDLYFGGVQAIARLEDGSLHAGADPRRSGKALAW